MKKHCWHFWRPRTTIIWSLVDKLGESGYHSKLVFRGTLCGPCIDQLKKEL